MTLAIAGALVALTLAALLARAVRRSVGYRISRACGDSRLRRWRVGLRSWVGGLRARLELVRERRRRGGLSETEQLLEDVQALRPPDELPQAPDLTRAQRRHLRGRAHPIARKRRTGGWG